MTQPATVTVDNVEEFFHYNDTVKYARDGEQIHTQLGTIKEIEIVGARITLVVLPIGADHTIKIDANDAAVVHPALDLPALTDMLGLPAHEQSAVQAFTGEDYGYRWSFAEALQVAYVWHGQQSKED